MKDKFINIRVSKEDYQKIKNDPRKNYDIFMSGFLHIDIKDQTEIIKQVKLIGNNINQIARMINKEKNPNKTTLSTKKFLIVINEELKKLYDYKNDSSQKHSK